MLKLGFKAHYIQCLKSEALVLRGSFTPYFSPILTTKHEALPRDEIHGRATETVNLSFHGK